MREKKNNNKPIENVLNAARVLVIGLARSGFSAAKLLLEKGFEVRVSESGAGQGVSEKSRALEALGATVETGSHSDSFLDRVDLVVASPGVPDDNELVQKALAGGVRVIGELELASRYIDTPVIAVTGTNGKTTTASLVAHCLRSAGQKNLLAGNVGIPLSSVIEEASEVNWLVLEVSSYQIARTVTFHPRVSVFLNLSSDHLDRYGSLDEYFAHKRRLFINQVSDDTAVLNAEEKRISSIADGTDARVFTFSRTGNVREGAFVEGGKIMLKIENTISELCSTSSIPIPGSHNLQNVLAAACALTAAGCTAGETGRGIETFNGLPHRIEDLGTHSGVRFVNDSKATNVSSTRSAIESIDGPIVLIMGGRHKGEPYTGLVPVVSKKVRQLVVIGEAAPLIEADLVDFVKTARAEDLKKALRTAMKSAEAGDVILLSPACSSFDMFDNFEDRGNTFKELVREISG